MATDRPRTLGELKSSGYRIESVKDEMRRNLIAQAPKRASRYFPTSSATKRRSSPRSRTRSSRGTTCSSSACAARPRPGCCGSSSHLLDDAMPVVAGSEINDDPYRSDLEVRPRPGRRAGRRDARSTGSAASDRYHEKLATPDVTIADLIGEVDMIKHAEGRYLSSELTMHFGLIPRTNRGIFCINELPDLAPKIQVGLFNVLEERDIQIRGYPIRLDLDLCMVFSANPEDYTNRGRIVTPLKDRIGSVVRTHYPLTRETRHRDQRPERLARSRRTGAARWSIPVYIKEIVEEIVAAGPDIAAREPAVGRLGPDVDRQPGERGLQRRAAGPRQRRALDRPARLRPGSRRGQLARQARADDDRGRRPRRQADRPDHRRGRQEHLRATTSMSASSARSSSTSSRARASRSATCCRPRTVLERIDKVPGLRKRAEELGPTALARISTDRDAREAATASAAEFILEGLHVHNKLNKAIKAGATTYRR